jgi:hypothetical protein
MRGMDEFEKLLVETLQARPGQTRDRLAAAMKLESTEDFREQLSAAVDRNLIHKTQDKYFPGTRKSY